MTLFLKRLAFGWLWMVGCVLCAGCLTKQPNEVVVYTALDREFSQPILEEIGRELDLTVRPKYDQESNKTVGLATELLDSRQRPRADVFWNNEILHTLRLQRAGVLDVYRSPVASEFPDAWVSPAGQWHGLAGRARVLIINTQLLPDPEQWPRSVAALSDPQWRDRCGMARPVFGTTATQAAVWLAQDGAETGRRRLQQIADNAVIEGGNKQVAQKVARGELVFGLTDTDDAILERDQGLPVAIVFPDQEPGQPGTLMIPNTLGLIRGGPNPEAGRRLIDRLLRADVEHRLAAGASAQIPLGRDRAPGERVESLVDGPWKQLRWQTVDFGAAADAWDAHREFLATLK